MGPQRRRDQGRRKTQSANRPRRSARKHPQQQAQNQAPGRQSTLSQQGLGPNSSAANVNPLLSQDNPLDQAQANQQNQNDDYLLLLKPEFSAMTKITDHLFLTGVGGMTKANFRKNHIDFVVNITTEAPFWEDIESMRVPLEDDPNANILPYLDTAVDRIQENIVSRNYHVLVHCVAGVSRSAAIVIAYLMKFKKMTLRDAFNYCYNLRPVIRPNNGFMMQLINYEITLYGRGSVHMVDANVEGTIVHIPNFFIEDHPRLVMLEVLRVKEQQRLASIAASAEEKNKPRIQDD